MVGTDFRLVDGYPLPFAESPENCTDFKPLEPIEFLPPVLGGEHYVVLTVSASMR